MGETMLRDLTPLIYSMFEQNSNSNQEPEDIFAQSEKGETATPQTVSSRPLTPDVKIKAKSKVGRTIIIILIILILAGAVYFLSNKFSVQIKNIFSRLTTKSAQENPITPAPSTNVTNSTDQTNQAVLDSDYDGLIDTDEQQLGADPNKADTDGDGLVDGEEVNIYHTDPLKADTDGDGIADGLEVRQGTNPLDPAPGAELLDLQKAINDFK